MEYIKASAALPLFTNLIKHDGLVLTDGGVSDSIPIVRAINDGFVNNVIVLTRPKGFLLGDNKLMKYYRIRYKNYPNLIKTMEERKFKYNETLRFIEEEELKGNVIVIRPKENLNIDNLEKNKEKIERIYNMGYNDGIEYSMRVKNFMKVKENEKKD